MEQKELLIGRIRDLSERTYQNEYLTHTDFLSAPELSQLFLDMKRLGMPPEQGHFQGVPFVVYGGRADADRNVLCFLPGFQSKEEFLSQEAGSGTVLRAVHVLPKSRHFTEELSHRDYLGALMQLGIERSKIGDILVGHRKEDAPESKDEAYIFVLSEVAELVAEELLRVKHTSVSCTAVLPGECRLSQEFRELSGSVASERLDAVLAMVYRLSRGTAQELIEREQVLTDGRLCLSPGFVLRAGMRVSVRGHGRFLYEGMEKQTKKGRSYVRVRVFV